MDELRRLDDWSDSSEEALGQLGRLKKPRKRRSVFQLEGHARALDTVTTFALSVMQLALGVGFILLCLLDQFSYDRCSDTALECNFYAGIYSWYFVIAAVVVALVGSVIFTVRLHIRNRATWWVPLAWLALPLLATIACFLLTAVGTGQINL